MRSSSKKPKLRWKAGMSQPRFPSEKWVAVAVTLRAYRDQAGIFGPHAKPGFEVNGQVGDNNQDAVVAVAEVQNQFRHGFTRAACPSMRKHSAMRSMTSWRSTGQSERKNQLWRVRGVEVHGSGGGQSRGGADVPDPCAGVAADLHQHAPVPGQ
jgi:hypothetical protein